MIRYYIYILTLRGFVSRNHITTSVNRLDSAFYVDGESIEPLMFGFKLLDDECIVNEDEALILSVMNI